jgi:membrane protein DedA with SNARE-associated domain
VIAVVTAGGEVGGLIGYHIGFRWGRALVQRPGKHQAARERTLERGEALYARWGRVAVFVTPAIVSGTAKMERREFAVWNLLASFGFALLTVAGAYGIGRIGTGHHSAEDFSILVVGAGAGLVIYEIARRHRRLRGGG